MAKSCVIFVSHSLECHMSQPKQLSPEQKEVARAVDDNVEGFSFTGLMKRQAEPCQRDETSQAAASGKKVRKTKGSGAQSTKEGTKCRVCDECCAGTSPFCWDHKRAFGVLCKDATKDKKSQRYEDYKAIFGEGRKGAPDKALADQVIAEFALARLTAAAEGKALPQCNLTKYRHLEGHRASDEAVKGHMMWDKEIFLTRMPQYRPWDKAKCVAEWDKLQSNPAILKDVGYNNSVVCKIPPELIGNVKSEERKGSFEQRDVSTETKAAKVSDSVRKAWIAQTAAGFHTPGAMAGKSISEIQTAFSSGLAVGSIGLHGDAKDAGLLEGILERTAMDQAQLDGTTRKIIGEDKSSEPSTEADGGNKRKPDGCDAQPAESPTKKKKE